MREILQRYALLALVLPGLVIAVLFPQLVIQLRYFHVLCIILAAFNGKAFIQEQDVKGWLLQNVALLLHAVCLIFENLRVA